jgi:hypothetical protein
LAALAIAEKEIESRNQSVETLGPEIASGSGVALHML